jgi:hypothetical protein
MHINFYIILYMDNNMNIDLNIDNYNIGELKSFFKLTKNYSNAELDKKVTDMVKVVSSSESTYKYQTLDFITQAKQILILKEPDISQQADVKRPESIKMLGSVIEPMSRAQSMQFSRNAVPIGAYGNGYGNNTVHTKNYVMNTIFRDNFFSTTATNSTFTLPKKLKNVISIDLSGLQFPNFIFTFTKTKKTTSIYIKEDGTGLEATVTIPGGNYDQTNMPTTLEKAINEQVVGSYTPGGPNRFTVSISDTTYFTTITNSTNTFTMITNSQANDNLHDATYQCANEFNSSLKNTTQQRYFRTEFDDKKNVKPEQYFQSLGWLLGYRSQIYEGKKKYTSEGHFDSTFINYIYFAMNDYSNNYTSNTLGLMSSSYISNNILAVIPITSPVWTGTFDNNANFIYKTRDYNGTTDISKISIQLLNPFGEEISIHGSDFAFCLQVTHLVDPKEFIFSDIRSNY